jgi:hypothetical protein
MPGIPGIPRRLRRDCGFGYPDFFQRGLMIINFAGIAI